MDSGTIDLRGRVRGTSLKDDATYYIIELTIDDSDTWEVKRRFSQFDHLMFVLKKRYNKLPKMPEKTLFGVKASGIAKRATKFSKMIEELCMRPEIQKDSEFMNFIKLEPHLEQDGSFKRPRLVASLEVDQAIRSFEFIPEKKLVIVMTIETSSGNKTMFKVSNFWEADERCMMKLGALKIFKVREVKGRWRFKKVWEQIFQSVPSVMYRSNNYLAVGMVTGKVKQFEFPEDWKLKKGDSYQVSIAHSFSRF